MIVNLRLLTTQIVGMFLVIGLALFFAAGTAAWGAGWLFLALMFSFTVGISLWLVRDNPALLTERMTGIGKPDQKAWDKVFFVVANVLFLAWLILMPLDAVRLHWSRVPAWLQVLGGLALVGSFYVFFLVFRENAYLSPAVRIQKERGQTVVSTGPYRLVRHPMYAGAIMLMAGTSLLLGSWYGLLAVLLMAVAITVRAAREERTLRAELPGYAEYTARVRHRFIPFVW